MQFFTIAALLAAASIAAPITGSTEVITIESGTFRRNDDDSNDYLKGISFTMKSEASEFPISCSVSQEAPIGVNELHACDDAAYKFGLVNRVGYGLYKLTVYHQTSDFAGLNGNVTIGCNGPIPTACSFKGYPTTTLCSDLNVCGDVADN